jgi:hypothetical protein
MLDQKLKMKNVNLQFESTNSILKLWDDIEKFLFYKYYWFSRIEYTQGVRTLARLISNHPDWFIKKYNSVEAVVKGIWHQEIYKPQILGFETEENDAAVSAFHCKYCDRKGKVSISIRQTASNDEAENVYYKCGDCGKTWKD